LGKNSSSGRWLLNGANQQYIESSAIGSPTFGHLEHNNTNGLIAGSNIEANEFTFNASSLVNIGRYEFKIGSGGLNGSGYSSSKMFITDGTKSARGVNMNFTLSGSYADSVVVYPVGVTGAYTPVTLTLNGNIPSTDGYYSVCPVDTVHPASREGSNALDYYWKTRSEGSLSNLDSIYLDSVRFDYIADLPYFRTWRLRNNEWIGFPLLGDALGTGNESYMIYLEEGFFNADYTAGASTGGNQPFDDVIVFYSRQSGNWDNTETWSLEGHNGPALPMPNGDRRGPYWPILNRDVIFIGNNHEIDVTRDIYYQVYVDLGLFGFWLDVNSTIQAADVNIEETGTLNITGDYNERCEFNTVNGSGRFRIANENGISSVLLPYADFGDFVDNDTAVFEYYGDQDYTIPSRLDRYPHLQIAGNANTVKTLPNKDILVQQDLLIYDDVNTGVTLRLNNAAGTSDLYIQDSLFLDNEGVLQYPSDGEARTVTIEKSVQMSPGGSTDVNSLEVENAASGESNHQFIIKNDIVTGGSGITFYTANGNRAVDLYFNGSNSSTVTRPVSGTDNLVLNHLFIEKAAKEDTVDMLSDFTLTDNTDMALHLNRGVFRMGNSNIDISLSSGDGDFQIPSSAAMILDSGRAEVTGASTGIFLDALLQLNNNSILSLDDGTNDNYIEYSSSGNAILDINDSSLLTVGSQIRRGLVASTGILKYRQTGGTMIAGKNTAPDGNRGVLEVVNSGSEFTHTGGNLVISRGQTDASVASVYLDPASSSVSDTSTLQLGDSNTPASSVIGINSSVPLSNILVDNTSTQDPTVQLLINDLILTGNLELDGNTTFNANNLDLTLAGDFINYGTYIPGTNNTTFNGAKQKMIGNTDFYDIEVSSTDSLLLSGSVSTDLTITNSLTVNSAYLIDSANTITVSGDIDNSGTHISTAASGGIILDGPEAFEITGGGTFGRVELDNPEGVSLTSDISIQNNLNLTNGVLRIREYLLRLDGSLQGTGFGEDKMIQTSGAASNDGFQYNIPSGTGNYTVPIGAPLEYTPVDIFVTANPSNSQLTFKPVIGPHPTITATDSVLQYYWKLESANVSNMSANLVFHYQQSDVPTPYGSIELDYIPAYLYNAEWAKFSPEDVDNFENEIYFNFTTVDNLAGEYTAGHTDAIPDSVPEFTTVANGLWNNENIWLREGEINPGDNVPDDGPNGFIVNIEHTVQAPLSPPDFGISAYETRLLTGGELDLRGTYGHYLGEVSGTGALAIDLGKLPGGEFDLFFNCSGGALEYNGFGKSYTTSPVPDTLRILKFTGTGTRTLPKNDLVICDSLIIDGPSLDNNTWDNKITLFGTFARFDGIFDAGNTANAIVEFSGTSQQSIPTSFTGNTGFYNLNLDNSNGLVLQDSVEVTNELNFTNGIIQTADTSVLYLSNTSSNIVTGAGNSNYVDGPLDKEIISSGSFDYPVGDGGKIGQIDLFNTSTTGSQRWQAQFYNENPFDGGYDPNLLASPLVVVSQEEYWHVEGPVGGESEVRIFWDSQSQIGNLTSDPANELRIAEWDASGSQWVDAGSDINTTDQTIATDSRRTLDEHAYTFGSTNYSLPTIDLEAIQADICQGDTAILRFELTGESPWDTLIYHHPTSGNDTLTTINSSPLDVDTLTTPGQYWVVKLKDANGVAATDLGDTVVVNVEPLPDPEINGDMTVCQFEEQIYNVTNDPTHYYSWTVLGGDIVSGAGTNQITVSWQNAGAGTVEVTEGVTGVTGCEAITDTSVTVYETPQPNVTATPAVVCYPKVVTLDAGASGFNYQWTPADSLNDATAESPLYTPGANPDVESLSIRFEVTIENTIEPACSAVDSIDVILYRKPETGNQYYVPDDFNQ
jgi:hypothetical protein